MNKSILLKVLGISLSITVGFSILIGLAGSTIIGSFWSWFFLSLLGLIVLFAITNSYFLQKDSIIVQEIENEALEKISKITIRLNCAYCNQPNTFPVQLSQKNSFVCESCNQTNGVSINFMATTLTTPIESLSFTNIEKQNSNSIEIKAS